MMRALPHTHSYTRCVMQPCNGIDRTALSRPNAMCARTRGCLAVALRMALKHVLLVGRWMPPCLMHACMLAVRCTGGTCPDIQATLDAHNQLRALHGSPPLTWSPKLAEVGSHTSSALSERLRAQARSVTAGTGHSSKTDRLCVYAVCLRWRPVRSSGLPGDSKLCQAQPALLCVVCVCAVCFDVRDQHGQGGGVQPHERGARALATGAQRCVRREPRVEDGELAHPRTHSRARMHACAQADARPCHKPTSGPQDGAARMHTCMDERIHRATQLAGAAASWRRPRPCNAASLMLQGGLPSLFAMPWCNVHCLGTLDLGHHTHLCVCPPAPCVAVLQLCGRLFVVRARHVRAVGAQLVQRDQKLPVEPKALHRKLAALQHDWPLLSGKRPRP